MDLFAISYAAVWALVIVEGVAIVVLTRTLGSMLLGSRDAIERDGLEIGTPAPDFRAAGIAGADVRLSELRGGRVVLVFAYPSCRICREMLGSLGALERRLAGVARVMVLLRASQQQAAVYVREMDPSVPVLAIGGRGTADEYRVRVSPFVHVVDPEGVVRAKGLVNGAYHI